MGLYRNAIKNWTAKWQYCELKIEDGVESRRSRAL